MLDPLLRPHATDRQWEIMEAIDTEGTAAKAAIFLGINKSNVNRARANVLYKAAQKGYAPGAQLHNPTAPGFSIIKTSTMRDADDNVKLRWTQECPDKQQQEALFKAAVEAMCEAIPPAQAVNVPKSTNKDLLVAYPVGDHHFGMQAWGEECMGEDYDMARAEELLCKAMEHLVEVSEDADEAVILVLGDFLHFDGTEPTTQSGHVLDAAARFQMIIRVALKSIRYLVRKALTKHKHVRLILESGNHDKATMPAFTEMFFMYYEDEPRITVDRSPHNCHAFQFGKCLIATHHGDKMKPQQLLGAIITDFASIWGLTEHRYVHTGHVHHDHIKELPGLMTESHGILAPKDAYAAKGGYRSKQSMKSITYHREFGEVGRQMFTPQMIK